MLGLQKTCDDLYDFCGQECRECCAEGCAACMLMLGGVGGSYLILGLLVLLCKLPSIFAVCLDKATGGGPIIAGNGTSLNDTGCILSVINDTDPFPSSTKVRTDLSQVIKARVQNTTAMPVPCRNVLPFDMVANISVAAPCAEWCHEALGPNSAMPYMLSSEHMNWILGSEEKDIFLMCFKTQTAEWALRLMPEWYWVYLLAMVYGIWSILAFCHTFRKIQRRTVPGGPVEDHVTADGPYGRRCGDIPCCCLPVRSNPGLPLDTGWNEPPLCYSVSSDRNGSEINLWIAAFFIWFEPFGDIVSILTLLRIGQPFPAAFMAFGIVLACAIACDPLQLSGACAVAESLRQGFETQALLQHKRHELWETLVCTSVQVYTLMTLHPKTMKLSTVLPLLVTASLNLVVSIPAGRQAIHVLDALRDSEWTFDEIQRTKSSFARWKKMVPTVLCLSMGVLAAAFLGGFERSRELWPILFAQDTWQHLWAVFYVPENWQQRLCALLLICFRLVCECTAMGVLIFAVCMEDVGESLQERCCPSGGHSNSQGDGPLLGLLGNENSEQQDSPMLRCLKCKDSHESSEEPSED